MSTKDEIEGMADEQRRAIERDIDKLERELEEDEAGGGVVRAPGQARFVYSVEAEEAAMEELTVTLTPEEKAAHRGQWLETLARTVGFAPEVLDAVFAAEKALKGFPVDVRRKALASALWRQLSGMNESVELWVNEVRLRDGGREVSFDMQALWEKERQG